MGARGRFVTLEGPEGGGKSTQLRALAVRLAERGVDVVTTREPGGTRLGEAARRILQHDAAGAQVAAESELFLFLASRAQLVREVILPALAKGAWVVCDRFADSTVAYQGYARGFDIELLLRLNALAIGPAVPDLTLLLDLDVERGFARLGERQAAGGEGHDRLERESRAFHERVRAGYLELAARWPERFRVIDAGGERHAVGDRIWETVCDAFRGEI